MQNLYIVTPNSIADGELDDITRLKHPLHSCIYLFVSPRLQRDSVEQEVVITGKSSHHVLSSENL